MNNENKELIEDSMLIKESKESYLKKETFIKMIKNLDFTEVKDARITFISGYQIKFNDKGDPYVQTLGYDIDIS